jgi:hypothetical protein
MDLGLTLGYSLALPGSAHGASTAEDHWRDLITEEHGKRFGTFPSFSHAVNTRFSSVQSALNAIA